MDDFETLLGNLKIISRVPRNGRLRRLSRGVLTIETDAVWAPFRRMLYHDSRSQTLSDVRYLYKEAFSELDRLSAGRVVAGEWHGGVPKAVVLERVIRDSLSGLENLKGTYSDDVNVSVSIDIILEKAQSRLDPSQLDEPIFDPNGSNNT
jgi:hypothetical protein